MRLNDKKRALRQREITQNTHIHLESCT